MAKAIRVLLVEDSEDDATLVLLVLRRGGYAPTFVRVEDRAALLRALQAGPWDVCLSDWTMPGFGAPEALDVIKESGLDLPFIVVSGTIGEETAVDALRSGAQDFVLKGKLTRLIPAIERELRETRRRAEHLAQQARSKDDLQRSDERFRLLVESVRDYAIFFVDPERRVLTWNSGAQRIFGYTAEEIVGRPTQLFSPDTPVGSGEADADLTSALAEGRYEDEGWCERKDGTRFRAIIALTPVRDGAGAHVGFATIVRDLTERRSLEEQLRHAQKMEAVGRLAGGIAHDFNNVLSVILSYAQMIGEGLDPVESLWADIEEIRKAGLRAADLTRQLLAFSRQQVLEPKVLDLNSAIVGMEKLLQRLLGADVVITTLPMVGLWSVKVDPGQLEQVVMNLAVNARDAMPRGGMITIETKNVVLDEDYVRAHHDVRAGSYVMIAVSDTGMGMDRATQAHMFEPFFTTKDRERGTGLGLATVFGIVKQSGGHIWVYSEVGVGTTFRIYLPKVDGAIEARSSLRGEPEALRGSETILLVEDDDQVRAVARSALRRNGYVVVEASNAGEALLACEQHGAKIHLLLSDVVLPRMSGRQLAARLMTMRPEMKVLYMSGYTDDAILQHGILDSDVAYLQKPLTPDALARKVREVLGG